MQKKTVIIVRSILISLSVLLVITGVFAFVLIMNGTPDYRVIKDNVDVTDKYLSSTEEVKAKDYSYVYEDLNITDKKEIDTKFTLDLNTLKEKNSSFTKFRVNFSLPLINTKTLTTADKFDYQSCKLTYDGLSDRSLIKIDSEYVIKIEGYTFDNLINAENNIVFNIEDIDDVERTLAFSVKDANIILLGAK